MGLCGSKAESTTAVQPTSEKLVYEVAAEGEEGGGSEQSGGSRSKPRKQGSLVMRSKYEVMRERRQSSRYLRPEEKEGDELEAAYTPEALARVKRAFQGNALFQHLQEATIEAIFQEMVPIKVEPQTLVFHKGEDAVMFYVVDAGLFAAGDDDGNKIEEFDVGASIGEEALLAKSLRPYNVLALQRGKLWAMDRLKYQQVLVKASAEQSAQTITSLRTVPLLKPLSEEQLQQLQLAFRKVTYQPGAPIIKQGDEGDEFFIVHSGRVNCQYDEDVEGKRVRHLGPGDFFGEGALLTDKPRSMNVMAAPDGPVMCMVLDKESFDQTLAPLQDLLSHNFFVRVLSGVPLFAPLSNDELERVSENMTLKEYGDGEPIITQGEASTKFYIIKSGRVRVVRSHVPEEGGTAVEEEMGVMVAGDYFGEGGFLTGEVRSASCIASGPSTVCAAMDREAFGEVLASLEPALAQQFAVRQSLWESPEEEEAMITLKDLETVARLGKGNFGSVNIVRHKVTGRTYALKKMSKEMIEKRGIMKYVTNERYILSRIRCPFIVRLHRTYRTKHSVLFLMDVLIGGELQPRIINAPYMNPNSARFYAANIALALIYMHERGVVHRDLKGENVMIHQSGYLKLVDFGMATRLKKGQRAHTMCGTPEYVAPEIMTQGSGVGYGMAVDWWAFGVIVGLMMNKGRHPINIPLSCSLPKAWRVLVRYVEAYPSVRSLQMSDPDAQDLVTRLLHPNSVRRMGMGKRGARGVMKHPFFAGVDWERMANRQLDPPFVPEVKDLLDISNFHKGSSMSGAGASGGDGGEGKDSARGSADGRLKRRKSYIEDEVSVMSEEDTTGPANRWDAVF